MALAGQPPLTGAAPFAAGSFWLEPGPIPMHHQVYLHLRQLLDEGKIRRGDRLPGERELCEFYGCSLVTIRRALDELTRERRLVRMRGRGTFVTDPPMDRNLALLDSFTEEMRRRGLDPASRVLAATSRLASPAVAEALGLAAQAPTIVLERLRLADEQPLMLETVHLSADRFPGLLEEDLEGRSLYEILASRFGVRLKRAEETIEPVALSAREAQLLEQKRGRPALLLHLIAFDQHDAPIEYCRALMRGDRARYHVNARGTGLGTLRLAKPDEN